MADNAKINYFLSIGRRLAIGGKLKHFFIEIDEEYAKACEGPLNTDSATVSFGSDKVKGSPGSIFAIPCVDNDRYDLGKVEYVGKWADEAQNMRWLGMERESMAEHNRKKRLKDACGTPEIFASLDTAREAYGRSMGSHRPQLLAAFVEYITRG